MFDFEDYEGSRQRFFRVTDPKAIQAAAAGMAGLPIFIADGHHRYETSLAYQTWLQERYPQASPRASFNYVLMYLSNMLDPDLVIRPAHRLLDIRRLQHFEEADPAVAVAPILRGGAAGTDGHPAVGQCRGLGSGAAPGRTAHYRHGRGDTIAKGVYPEA